MEQEGGCVGSYEGHGTMKLQDETEWECHFELEHHIELGVLLECTRGPDLSPVGPGLSLMRSGFQAFSGTTSDGNFTIESIRGGHYRSINADSQGNATFLFALDG